MAGYLFLDVHHTVFDGTSSKVFFADVLRAYAGQDLEPDYYYYILSAREQLAASDFYLESKQYFEEKYDGKDWCKHPSTDHKTRENKGDELYVLLPVKMDEVRNRESQDQDAELSRELDNVYRLFYCSLRFTSLRRRFQEAVYRL